MAWQCHWCSAKVIICIEGEDWKIADKQWTLRFWQRISKSSELLKLQRKNNWVLSYGVEINIAI